MVLGGISRMKEVPFNLILNNKNYEATDWDLEHLDRGGLPFPPTSFLITESQNHRIVGVGRDLCGSSSPTPLPKQGHLQQAAQDLVQAGLEYLQRRRLHNLPGQPVPVLRHPQREEVLPHVQTESVLKCSVSLCSSLLQL